MEIPYSPLAYVEDYVVGCLSADSVLSATTILAQSRRDISYEIKNTLGRQGLVTVVMCEKANYIGNYQDDCLAWEIPQLVVETVENESVNRHKPNNEEFLTSQDVACRVADVLCPCAGDYEGQFSPVSIENGENRSLLVSKATFKCLVHASAQTPYPPRPGPIPVPSYEDLSVKIDILSGDVEQLKLNKVDIENGYANNLSVNNGTLLSCTAEPYFSVTAGTNILYKTDINKTKEFSDRPGAYSIKRINIRTGEVLGEIWFPNFHLIEAGTTPKVLATTDQIPEPVDISQLSTDVEQLKTNKIDVNNGSANTLSVYGGILSGVNIAYSNFNAGNANSLSVRLPIIEKTPSYSYTVGVNVFPEMMDTPGAYYIQRKNATGTENYGRIGFPAFGTSGTKILATTDQIPPSVDLNNLSCNRITANRVNSQFLSADQMLTIAGYQIYKAEGMASEEPHLQIVQYVENPNTGTLESYFLNIPNPKDANTDYLATTADTIYKDEVLDSSQNHQYIFEEKTNYWADLTATMDFEVGMQSGDSTLIVHNTTSADITITIAQTMPYIYTKILHKSGWNATDAVKIPANGYRQYYFTVINSNLILDYIDLEAEA